MTARHLTLVLSWLAASAPAALAAVVLPDDLTVRVYDTSSLPLELTTGALTVAGRTLGDANVFVTWRQCNGGHRRGGCDGRARSGDIILRIVRAGALPSRGHGAAAALRSRAGLPLGDAFVDARARTGVLATVYADRVMLLAEAPGLDAATLLGYAIAHEVGHLLLASNTHGSRGIMRAVWSAEALRSGRAADWQFTRAEAAAMRRRLDTRETPGGRLPAWMDGER